jgi:hypothetical protein
MPIRPLTRGLDRATCSARSRAPTRSRRSAWHEEPRGRAPPVTGAPASSARADRHVVTDAVRRGFSADIAATPALARSWDRAPSRSAAFRRRPRPDGQGSAVPGGAPPQVGQSAVARAAARPMPSSTTHAGDRVRSHRDVDPADSARACRATLVSASPTTANRLVTRSPRKRPTGLIRQVVGATRARGPPPAARGSPPVRCNVLVLRRGGRATGQVRGRDTG